MAGVGEVHIGHAVGILLDHGPRFGRAEVRVTHHDRDPEVYRVAFIKPDLWRAEGAGDLWVCDGSTTTVRAGGGAVEARPAGEGRRPRPLHPFFPIDAPIWGRGGDDWRLTAAVERDETLLRVRLEHCRSPEFSASIAIDAENELLREMRFPGYAIEVTEFHRDLPEAGGFRTVT